VTALETAALQVSAEAAKLQGKEATWRRSKLLVKPVILAEAPPAPAKPNSIL